MSFNRVCSFGVCGRWILAWAATTFMGSNYLESPIHGQNHTGMLHVGNSKHIVISTDPACNLRLRVKEFKRKTCNFINGLPHFKAATCVRDPIRTPPMYIEFVDRNLTSIHCTTAPRLGGPKRYVPMFASSSEPPDLHEPFS